MMDGKSKATKASKVLQPSTSQNLPGKSIEEVYQKKSQLEHILLRPDTYIGSTETQQQKLWVHDGEQLVLKDVEFVPGLYKIFDEILVNAADNKVRDPKMDALRVDIDPVRLHVSMNAICLLQTDSLCFDNCTCQLLCLTENLPIVHLRRQTPSACGTMGMEYRWKCTRKKRCTCRSSFLVTC